MKRLLGFIAILSIGFACEEPFEDIAGFKIGCELTNTEDSIASKTRSEDVGLIRSFTFDNVDFFDTADVELDKNGIARVILFTKEYLINRNNIQSQKDLIKNEFIKLYSTIEKRWGEFDIKDADLLLQEEDASGLTFLKDINHQVVEINYPKSDTVGWIIMFTQSHESDTFLQGKDKIVQLHLIYIDKKTLKMAQTLSKKQSKAPAESMEGF